MDPVSLPALATAIGSALVTAMTTDAWQGIRARIAELLRRADATHEHDLYAQLRASRAVLLAPTDASLSEALKAEQIQLWTQTVLKLLEHDESLIAPLTDVLDIL